jgi:1-deoxy-D-xylulose-5-phosphate reductoisomerase
VVERARPGQIVPVDSEHSALAQCLRGGSPDEVRRLVLTASGGPFRGRSVEELHDVTVEQALAHPTWAMGGKITVDSATLMNKGLELIEAHHLFGMPYRRIEVVVHPQSIVHGMARYRDGALIAHLGLPDMRVPISYALSHPHRAVTPAPRLDLSRPFSLDFEPPDAEAFRCLALARQAGESGGTAPCVLNAANEVAVAAFLSGGCSFPQIADTVEAVLDRMTVEPLESVPQVLAADARARELARATLGVAV